MSRLAEVVLILVYVGCLLLWASYRPTRRDDGVDALAERKARELAGRDA